MRSVSSLVGARLGCEGGLCGAAAPGAGGTGSLVPEPACGVACPAALFATHPTRHARSTTTLRTVLLYFIAHPPCHIVPTQLQDIPKPALINLPSDPRRR